MININQDFEEAFPNEVYLGFTLSQCLSAGTGMVLSMIAALFLWKFFSLPLVESTYITIPLMVPACAAGFFRYQGQSLPDMVREIRFSGKTEKLICKAGEYQGREERVYSLSRHYAEE